MQNEFDKDVKRWESIIASHRFAPHSHKNFDKARGMILEMHLLFDELLNIAISLYIQLGGKQFGSKVEWESIMKIFSKMPFGVRVAIVSKIGAYSKDTLSTINKVNEIRNAFAHHRIPDKKNFIYKGVTIFEPKGIMKVIRDAEKVIDNHNGLAYKLDRYSNNN